MKCEPGLFCLASIRAAVVCAMLWAEVGLLQAQLPPVVFAHPLGVVVPAGSTTVLSIAATGTPPLRFQWRRNGVPLATADSSRIVLSRPTASDSGRYECVVANAFGSDTSRSANLDVVPEVSAETGRLVNLSILTPTGPGARLLTLGTVIGPASQPGAMPLVIRAVGPTLGAPPFNLPGVLADPELMLFQGNVVRAANDDWGGTALLSAAFAGVGAFALPAASRDSAVWVTEPGATPGNYTVQVAGKAGSGGLVIAEIYDATGPNRTATTARLINLSTLALVEDDNALATGFVLAGRTGRTLLIRAVGPTLGAAPFGLPGVLADPSLELFARNGLRIGGNNDWEGEGTLRSVMAAVGAFPLVAADSRDAVLLVTLPPGDYTAQVTGPAGGVALLEVYEVP